MSTATATKTYRLMSAEWIYTPGMVQLAKAEFPFKPKWSIDLLVKGYSLPPKIAKGLASGAITYQVVDEAVVFDTNPNL